MTPTRFTDEERAFLPPHEEFIYAKDQPAYLPLPTVVLHGRARRTISRWTLTPAERASIAAGEDLYVEQLTFGEDLQPILPTVGLRTFCPADRM